MLIATAQSVIDEGDGPHGGCQTGGAECIDRRERIDGISSRLTKRIQGGELLQCPRMRETRSRRGDGSQRTRSKGLNEAFACSR